MSKLKINPRHPYLAKLKKWRTPIFNFSLLFSLAVVTYAFNWTSYPDPGKIEDLVVIPFEEEVKIVRTKHEVKRVPPPTVVKPSTEIIPEDIEYDPTPEPEVIDKKIDVIDIPREPITEPAVKKVIPKVEPLPELEEVETIFVVVEEMPRFDGCEEIIADKKTRKECATNKLMQFIYSNIKYPPIARENGIEGTVVLRFVVEKDGSITDINILKDIGGGCGTEAARVIKMMPDWIPGKQRGKEVRVQYNIPVKYKLN
ncbi:MAG: energy transducer TonB [Saprospiraceae bacterium]